MITEYSQKMLDFIIAYKREHDGLSPTYREMVRALGEGFNSTSMIHYNIRKLIVAGKIRINFHSRGIEVIGGSWHYTANAADVAAAAEGVAVTRHWHQVDQSGNPDKARAAVCLNCELPQCDEDHDPRCPFYQTWHQMNRDRANESQRALRQRRKEVMCTTRS